MNKEVLKTEQISKSFGGVIAIESFSMELFENEIRGIIGPNGAGKTTIFNVLSRIYKEDAGQIFLGGDEITSLNQIDVARAGLSRTFQNTRLFSGLNILDNVRVALDHDGRYSMFDAMFMTPKKRRQEKENEKKAMDCLELLDLSRYAKEKPAKLPYGLQRRVEIARGLVSYPKVLLLDEPAAGLNPQEVFDLIEFLKDIRSHYPKLAMLIIEHRMDVIMNLCTYIYVQDFGRTIASGAPEQIQDNPDVLAAYLGEEK